MLILSFCGGEMRFKIYRFAYQKKLFMSTAQYVDLISIRG